MASLTGQTIASTYDALLKITDNGPITASLKQITDGLGNNTPLYLSATTVFVDGNFRVSGAFYDVNNNAGTAGQFLVSTGTGVDWQNISESNLISGTGTNGFISKFTAAGVIADSVIQESGSNIGIGILPTQKLHVDGNGLFTGTLTSSNLSGSNTGDETKASIESKLGAASSSNDGYLTAANWTTFNAKQNQLNGTGFVKVTGTTVSYDNSVYALASRAINTSAPLSGGGDLSANRILSIARSNSVTDGYLAADDFASFNSRVPSTRTITINGDTQDLSANRTFNVNVGVTSFNTRTGAVVLGSGDVTTALGYTPANSSRIMTINGVGYNLSADRTWNVGTVTSINTSAPLTGGPITSSGTIGITQATTSTNGFLSSTDWNTFNNKQDALGFTPENTANKGAINGYASLDGAGKVPSTQLPSYVDDVVEVVNFAALPATGETGKIYITLDTNFVYRWSGSVYVKISEPNAVWGSITGTLSNQTDLQNALNAKQDTLTNPVTGTGTTNTLPKFTGASAIGNSNITDTGSLITLGSNSLVSGNISVGATTFSARSSVGLTRNISGDPSSYGIINTGQIQSGVTSLAAYNVTSASTQAASFTLNTLSHYYAEQGTIGAGSAVNTQNGFQVHSSLIGATNNYGFRGGIPAGTGRWNLYMDGTANNHMAGSLGIGTTNLSGVNLHLGKNISGATQSIGAYITGDVQTDATVSGWGFATNLGVASSALVPDLAHFRVASKTFGAGSTVTAQYGFAVSGTFTGATNNYAFYGNTPVGSGNWNIYMISQANNYLAGSLGIGQTALTGHSLRVGRNITGATTSFGLRSDGQVQSDVTGVAYYFDSTASTQATTFTLGNLTHYRAAQGTFGAGSTVTDQHGFLVASSLIGAAWNYGFRGQIPAGTNRWNLFMDGTANNYINGALGISTQTLTGFNINIARNLTGAITVRGIQQAYTIQSDVTNAAIIYSSGVSTAAATFTLPQLTHYFAGQGTIGAGSTVTDQHGFRVENTLIGATNNYGFRGQIPSGTGRWNLYMDGTANNYLAGNLGIGTTSPQDFGGTFKTMEVQGSTGGYVLASNSGASTIAQMGVGNAIAYYGLRTSGDVAFTTGNTERMRITSSGNVGIGISSATYLLQPGNADGPRIGLCAGNDRFATAIGSTNVFNVGQRLDFYVGDSGANGTQLNSSHIRMSILPSGNVGIGTTSPSSILHIQTSAGTASKLYIGQSATAAWSIGNNASANTFSIIDEQFAATRLFIGSTGNVGIGTSSPVERLDVRGKIYVNNGGELYIDPNSTNTILATTGARPLIFEVNSAERMRITSGGDLLVGATGINADDTGVKLFGQSGSLLGTIAQSKDYSSGTILYTSFETATPSVTQVGSITYNGSAVSYNTSSDYRLKEDLKDFSGVDLVKSIGVYDVKWKSNESRSHAVIAHELAEVLPYAVTGEKDGEQMQGVDYSKLVPILIKAIQEQQAQIEELKAKLQ